MALVRWDPWGELTNMQREMDRMLSRMGGRSGQREGGAGRAVSWMPRIDVKEKDGDLMVEAEVPGMDPDDIDISVTDNMLTISGERRFESEDEGEGYVVRERSYGSFERSMIIPEDVDPSSIEADYQEGILKVRIPHAAELQEPKTTRVSVGKGRSSAELGEGSRGGESRESEERESEERKTA